MTEKERYRLKHKFQTTKNEFANAPMNTPDKYHMNYIRWCKSFVNRYFPIRVRHSEKCMVMWKRKFRRKIGY